MDELLEDLGRATSEEKGTGKATLSAVSFISLCNLTQIFHGSSNMETSLAGLYFANRLKCIMDNSSIFKAVFLDQ